MALTEDKLTCDICSKEMDANRNEESFCHGCKSHICDGCDVNPDPPWGEHDKMIHKREPDTITW